MGLRRLRAIDRQELIAVYRDAVLSQTPGLYGPEQVRAWADHAGQRPELFDALEQRYGLASEEGSGAIAAFGLLDRPAQQCARLALLYCRGRCARQGHASAILRALEAEARRQHCRQLRTEASQLSRPLLLRQGWRIERDERLIFAGQPFLRWRMIKTLL